MTYKNSDQSSLRKPLPLLCALCIRWSANGPWAACQAGFEAATTIDLTRLETFRSIPSCCREGDTKQEIIPPWACGHVMCGAQRSPGFSLCESDMLESRWMGAIRMLQEQGSAPERSWSKPLLFPRRRLVDLRWHKHRLMNIWSHPGLHLTQLAQTQRAAAQQFGTACENICSCLAPTIFFFSLLKEGHAEGMRGEYVNVLFVYWCHLHQFQTFQKEIALF